MTNKVIQLVDGEWQPLGPNRVHYCCDCGLAHNLQFKLEGGVIYEKWTRNKKETVKARKKR